MSDQISTLPLVIWQPSRKERFAKMLAMKARFIALPEYQQRMLAMMSRPDFSLKRRIRSPRFRLVDNGSTIGAVDG